LVHNSDGCVLTNAQGLAAADSAADDFAKPGNMSGALYLEGYDDPISLSSGSGNLSDGYARPPGASTSNFHHLEAQAAATMRSTGIMDGQLFISGDYICGACADRLPQMLPDGATLRVTYQTGDGIQTQVFTGTSG
jgi:hypothetical protein